ncbi:MAG: hypothetical protein ACK4FG_04590 [Brevundimonas sp.]
MKTLPLALTALVVLSTPVAAEPDNPGAATRMVSEGYVRTPGSPTDRRLVGLTDRAAEWNGDPIWKLLIYCAAMHTARRDLLKSSGSPDQLVEEQDRLATRFAGLGAVRFGTDRGVPGETTIGAITAENAYWTFFFKARSFSYATESRTCREAEARDRRGR